MLQAVETPIAIGIKVEPCGLRGVWPGGGAAAGHLSDKTLEGWQRYNNCSGDNGADDDDILVVRICFWWREYNSSHLR